MMQNITFDGMSFDEKLQEIRSTMHELSEEEDARCVASMIIAQLCQILSKAYPQDVQHTVNQIVGDFNKIANT